jgi:soluble lytic murein transglycosylase
MMKRCSDRNTLGLSVRAAVLFLLTACLPAQDAALTRLASAAAALQRGDAAGAARWLAGIPEALPAIADYAHFFQLQAAMQLKDYPAATRAAERVLAFRPQSPLSGRAAVIGAGAWVESGRGREALELLARVEDRWLPKPEAHAALARALEMTSQLENAAAQWQRVFYEYPLANEAEEAKGALARLGSALGDRFPPVPPRMKFLRAEILLGARRHLDARSELIGLAGEVAGREKEIALVRAAAARYAYPDARAALEELRGLSCQDPEAEAERLHWTALCLRRLDRPREMLEPIEQLARLAPSSPWRLKTLVAAGNTFLLENQRSEYTPLYASCAESFPEAAEAAYCHWKIVWLAWMQRQPNAPALLREHLARFPNSDKASAALYYLARTSEQSADPAAARRFYRELCDRFPHSYYTVLANEQLSKLPAANGTGSASTELILSSIRWPQRERNADFRPDPLSAQRMQRARMLEQAGLQSWAYSELRFAANLGGNPWPIALELAEIAARSGDAAQGIRWIKAIAPAYLDLPRQNGSERFWKLAFPFPYRAAIERHARLNGLDPFLVAALIRQESEFDPKAISSARAVGLMQIRPPTGRELARRLRLRFRPAMLQQAEPNVRLGTYYFRRLLDSNNNRVEAALAAYNGGPSRVVRWSEWGEFREPSEFVETIPITQTREYVQVVLRNADIYRWLYAPTPPAKPASPRRGTTSVKRSK